MSELCTHFSSPIMNYPTDTHSQATVCLLAPGFSNLAWLCLLLYHSLNKIYIAAPLGDQAAGTITQYPT